MLPAAEGLLGGLAVNEHCNRPLLLSLAGLAKVD